MRSTAPPGDSPEHCLSDTTPPDRDGVLFLNGLDGRGGSARRSMSEEGAEAGFRPPPVLARRSTGEVAGGQAAAVAAAAAMAAAASSESPRGGRKKRWQRALRKLRLRPRCVLWGGGRFRRPSYGLKGVTWWMDICTQVKTGSTL